MQLSGAEAHHHAIQLAQSQAGVLARRQLRSVGWTDKAIQGQVDAGRWQRVLRGIYAVQTGELLPEAMWWGFHLIAGDESALAASTALQAAGLQLTRRQRFKLDAPTLCVPHGIGRRLAHSEITVHRVRTMPPIRSTSRLPPFVRPEYALLQAAADIASKADVVDLFGNVIQQRIASAHAIAKALELTARQRHRTLLRQLVSQVHDGNESVLEAEGTNHILRAHGLPIGRGQVEARANGNKVIRDRLLEPFRVIVEFDGRLGHEDSEGRFRDMSRDNAAQLDGYATLRFGWRDVHDLPCEAAAQVVRMLRLHGWTEIPSQCSSECRLR